MPPGLWWGGRNGRGVESGGIADLSHLLLQSRFYNEFGLPGPVQKEHSSVEKVHPPPRGLQNGGREAAHHDQPILCVRNERTFIIVLTIVYGQATCLQLSRFGMCFNLLFLCSAISFSANVFFCSGLSRGSKGLNVLARGFYCCTEW